MYGAGYDDSMRVICKKATSNDELKEMRGSKFVQSLLGNTYKDVKDELNTGKRVMYSGTPCQVEGLLCYLKKNQITYCAWILFVEESHPLGYGRIMCSLWKENLVVKW